MSYSKWGGFIDQFAQFDPLFFSMSPREAMNIDPQERLFLQESWRAMENAGYTRRDMKEKYQRRVGVFAGMANAVGMAGLPVASYFTAQGLAAGVFRGTLIAYFAVLDLFSIPVMWGSGIIVWDTVKVAAAALPIIGIGIWAGGRHFLATDPQDFRRFAIGLLAVLAVMNLIKAVL